MVEDICPSDSAFFTITFCQGMLYAKRKVASLVLNEAKESCQTFTRWYLSQKLFVAHKKQQLCVCFTVAVQNCAGPSLIRDITWMKNPFSSLARWKILGYKHTTKVNGLSLAWSGGEKELSGHETRSHKFLASHNKYYYQVPVSFSFVAYIP